jgi:hypothetical protein
MMLVNNLVPVPQQDLETLAGVIRTEHQAVGLAAKNMLEHALRAGDALQAAKQQVADGHWETWHGVARKGGADLISESSHTCEESLQC